MVVDPDGYAWMVGTHKAEPTAREKEDGGADGAAVDRYANCGLSSLDAPLLAGTRGDLKKGEEVTCGSLAFA
jgi:hypothetical protein